MFIIITEKPLRHKRNVPERLKHEQLSNSQLIVSVKIGNKEIEKIILKNDC